MKTRPWKNISIPARTKNIKALASRLLWVKTTLIIYAFMKHFTLESASLHSIPGKDVVNSHTFYFSILFYRPFFSAFRGPLSRDSPSLEPCVPFTAYFYSFHTEVTSFRHFKLLFLHIYIYSAHEYFFIPDDALIGESLNFRFYFLNSRETVELIWFEFHRLKLIF